MNIYKCPLLIIEHKLFCSCYAKRDLFFVFLCSFKFTKLSMVSPNFPTFAKKCNGSENYFLTLSETYDGIVNLLKLGFIYFHLFQCSFIFVNNNGKIKNIFYI